MASQEQGISIPEILAKKVIQRLGEPVEDKDLMGLTRRIVAAEPDKTRLFKEARSQMRPETDPHSVAYLDGLYADSEPFAQHGLEVITLVTLTQLHPEIISGQAPR